MIPFISKMPRMEDSGKISQSGDGRQKVLFACTVRNNHRATLDLFDPRCEG